MSRCLIAYFSTALVFWLLDAVWLGVVVKDFTQLELGPLLLSAPQKAPAIAFYLLYVVGIVIFVVLPALDTDSLWRALGLGALFGLIAYATYDLSNMATLKGWSTNFSLLDMAWGAFATAIASTAGWAVTRAVVARL